MRLAPDPGECDSPGWRGRWRQVAAWVSAGFLWVAAFADALATGRVAMAADRMLFGAAISVTVVLVILARADQHMGWRVRSLECQVRKLQAKADGENLVIEFARSGQPKVKHPTSNGNGRGPA